MTTRRCEYCFGECETYPMWDCYGRIVGYVCDDCTDEMEYKRQISVENGV